MNGTELTARYMELTKTRPDGRWSLTTLSDKVARAEAQKALHESEKARKEKEAAVAEQMRQSRVAARGPFEDFGKNFRNSEREDYQRLARAARWAQGVLDQHETVTAELSERFAKDPAYALSWSMNYYEHAANHSVAKDLKDMFEHGVTVESMLNDFSTDQGGWLPG